MNKKYVKNPTEAAQLIMGPGKLAGWHLWNGLGSPVFIQFFDKATAAEATPGTTAPNMVLVVPSQNPQSELSAFDGIEFHNGCVIACTSENDDAVAPLWGTGADSGDFNFFFQ